MDTIDRDGLEIATGGAGASPVVGAFGDKPMREQWGAKGREWGMTFSWPGMALGGLAGEIAGAGYDLNQAVKRYNAATPAYYRDPRRLGRQAR